METILLKEILLLTENVHSYLLKIVHRYLLKYVHRYLLFLVHSYLRKNVLCYLPFTIIEEVKNTVYFLNRFALRKFDEQGINEFNGTYCKFVIRIIELGT